MASPQLALAAQTNGRKSRGPVTPEGKRKSSANSRKHGLRSKTIQTDDACEAYRQRLLPSLIDKYQPANPVELNLVETVALTAAQQDWALRIFDQHLADAIEHQSNPDPPYKHPGRHAMPLLHRAFCRFDREERRARQQLHDLQSQKMHERTLSAPARPQAAPQPEAPTPPPPTIEKMHERTQSHHRHATQTHRAKPAKPWSPPHILPRTQNRPIAPRRKPQEKLASSPAFGNRKRT